MKYNIFFSLLLLIGAIQVNAQVISGDRPGASDSQLVVPEGSLQVEVGTQLEYSLSSRSVQTRALRLPNTLMRYGLTDRFELRLLSQYSNIKTGEQTTAGMNDLEIGTKVQLLDNDSTKLQMALLVTGVMPTGSRFIGGDDYGFLSKLIVAYPITDKLGANFNIGYSQSGEDTGDLIWSLSFGVAVNDKVGFFFEPYGTVEGLEDAVFYGDAGFTYLVSDKVQLDFYTATGFTNTYNHIGMGVSWLFD